MLRDSAAKLVLTNLNSALSVDVSGTEVVAIDALEADLVQYDDSTLLGDVNQGEDLACVLYTSGSTGVPKGVLIRNASIVGHVCEVNWIQFTQRDRVAQINNLSFDPVTTELWGAWLHAATLVLLPVESLLDSADLHREIRHHALTKLFIPAGLLNIHAAREPGVFGGLETLASGGEAASPMSFARILQSATPPRRLINVYGPTEATTQVTSYVVPSTFGRLGPLPARIPIGHPVTGARCVVLDSELRPVADGDEGELFVGGRPLSAGYLNRPELNAERFIADPASPEERLYRTGDLAVRSSDGTLDLVGRADEQIKIRDYRVEPGEIQAALHTLPGVAQSYVMLREDVPGARKLVAYVVLQPEARRFAATEMRKALRSILPAQIIPDAFVVLPELPLTPNRKIDRTRLPAPEGSRAAARNGLDAARASLAAANATAETLLPSDYPRARAAAAKWSTSSTTLAPQLASAMAELAARADVAVNDAWLTVELILLARWSGQEHIRVGVVEASQPAGLTAIDLTLPSSLSFEHALMSIREARAKASRDYSVQVGLATFTPSDSIARLCRDSGMELVIAIAQVDTDTLATVHYREELFDSLTIERWLRYLSRLVQETIERPQTAIADLQLLSDADRAQLLHAFNDTRADYPATKRLHDLVEERVHEAPRATAILYQDVATSYRALDRQSNQLAHHLRALGVGSGTIVGICLTRSPQMVAAMLGVLKAGGAYLPLDPEFPRERLTFMLADSGAAVLLTESKVPDLEPTANIETIRLDADAEAIAARAEHRPVPTGTADDLAYLIYTSGSTGNPKGVMISHRAAVNFIASMQRVPGLASTDRVLAVTTLSFDIALLELLLPLATGATIVLASARERIDPALLAKLLDRHAITLMQATPTTWTQLLLAGWAPKTEFRALVGGEVLPRKLALDLLRCASEVWNMYGPTETTVWSTCWRVTKPEQGIFIGSPIANTRCVVLEANGQLAPVGVYGELCIGGAGLARGYSKRDVLTAEKFISDPHLPGERLYRTGDRVRWRSNGLLEFDGRLDRQIKLRGFRIELGEIETELDACDAVERSYVVVREDRPGDRRLVAYVLSRGADVARIRQRLVARLPSHLIPSAIVVLDAFPLTANHKVDVKALPAPSDLPSERKFEHMPPHADPLHQELIEEWEETLDVRPVGVDDDFFELGGNSVLALTLLSRIAERFGRRLPLASFFETPTVRSQAQLLKNELQSNRASSIVGIRSAGTRLPLFFASGWGGPILKLRALSRALGPEQPLYLLDYFPDRAIADETDSIERIAARLISQMRSVQPKGPYQLVGYSLGAKIVYEIACQLRNAGESVPALILLDSYAPGHPHRPAFPVRLLLHLRKALPLGPVAMWPYLREHFGRMRQALLANEPTLYEGMGNERVPALLWELNRAASAVYRAQMRYRFKRYPGTLLLIRAEDLTEWGIGTTEDDPTGGWRDWVHSAVAVGAMQCGHRHMLDMAFAPELADMIRSALALAESEAHGSSGLSSELESRVSG